MKASLARRKKSPSSKGRLKRHRANPARQSVLTRDGTPPVTRREAERLAKMGISLRPGIERDTLLVPLWVAETVVAEAEYYIGEVFPDCYAQWLAEKADVCYAGNFRFRRRIRGQGNAGRGWLRVFMRHWLAAILKRERPDLFVYFPPGWTLGHSLTGRRGSRRLMHLNFIPVQMSWPGEPRPNPLFRSGRLARAA